MAALSTPAAIADIAIADIVVPAGRRRLDPAWVATLSELFASQGQLSPIEVISDDAGYRLVFGHHRLAAARLQGWAAISAAVKTASDFANEAEVTLREITENLARRQLSVLDRSVDIARWREIYEASHRLNKGGRKGKDVDPEELSTKFGLSFSEAAQKAFLLGRQTIFHAVKIASIASDVRDRIALHAIADNQSELLALAAETPPRQADIAALLTAEPAQAGSVADAIAILDRVPAPPKPAGWQKLADAFSRMKPNDQRRFFQLHEAAILTWLKDRGE